ncbi:hypothetical protein QFZ36_002265 [Pseudarthrobacter siccitolerans]|uniref:Uncharacterized protein n=1 Tax=Pseudarthrobacter siccitolerans TaxID=861266 RepID=A0ABU0PN55_9MICC|nr:hypothetical protein [Pseudarthrobacter siccitolerans]
MDTVVKRKLPESSAETRLPRSEPNEQPVGVAAWRVNQWSLLVGLDVEVRLEPGQRITGRVDDAMPDSTLLWLNTDGTGRRTIEKSRGHEVWLHAPVSDLRPRR